MSPEPDQDTVQALALSAARQATFNEPTPPGKDARRALGRMLDDGHVLESLLPGRDWTVLEHQPATEQFPIDTFVVHPDGEPDLLFWVEPGDDQVRLATQGSTWDGRLLFTAGPRFPDLTSLGLYLMAHGAT